MIRDRGTEFDSTRASVPFSFSPETALKEKASARKVMTTVTRNEKSRGPWKYS